MIERIPFNDVFCYQAIEGAIHIDRYMLARDLCRGKRVLDAACGEGYGSHLLSRWGAASVVGMDISDEAISNAKRNFEGEKTQFVCGNIENLQVFADHSFDLVVSLETIEHLKNPRIFLKEIKRVVKSEGQIILSCPNDYWYYPKDEEKNPYHHRKYTLEEFRRLAVEELGIYSHLFLGTPCAGFINIPTHAYENIEHENQMKMLKYKSDIPNIFLPADHIISGENSSYFIGIWGAFEKQIQENAVLYATSMNVYEDSKKNIDRMIADMGERIKTLEEKNRTLQAENRFFREHSGGYDAYLLESKNALEAEISFLRSRCKDFKEKQQIQGELCENITQKNQRLQEENQSLQTEHQSLQAENQSNKEKISGLERMLDEIIYSNGYALLKKYYRLKSFFQR